jgi:MerR family transcriptional regulator, heat shock protein HspR
MSTEGDRQVRDHAEGGKRPKSRRDQPDRAVYVISVAAELAGVHPQTLRIYERKGLLTPARTAGNTRRYSDRDIARLRMIQRLTQEAGLNLAGVKMIVEMESEIERMRRQMAELHRELQRAGESMREQLEQERRRYRAEMVPVSSVRRTFARESSRPSGGTRQDRRGPIVAGPSSVMAPGG